MVIHITLNGALRSIQTVPHTDDTAKAKRQALSAAIKAGDLTISQALQVQMVIVESA